jgi:Cdc6-like AAA superfamily ATPase
MNGNKRRADRPLSLNKEIETKKKKTNPNDSRKSMIPILNRDKNSLYYDIEDDDEEYVPSAEEEEEEELDFGEFKNKLTLNSVSKESTNKNNLTNNNIKSGNKNSVGRPKSITKKIRPVKTVNLTKSSGSNDESSEEHEIELLPCREKEQEYIYKYIKKGLETNGSYSGLYISGMPGTGKTACVTTIINKLSQEAEKKQVSNFNRLYINGMKVTNPNSVFKIIYDFIFSDGRSTNLQKCISILDNFFRNRKDFDYKHQLQDYTNPHTILVIDEIDCLINKKQMLLYNIFNWTTYSHSKLIIIAISNTLDLPEKLLPKISSRIGNNRLPFKPYQKEELVKILSVKIDNFDMFSDDAIKICSMKVAAVNGDLRRILQICRRAREIFDLDEEKTATKIDKTYVLRAIDDLFDGKVQKVIKSLQIYEKLALAGILFEMKLQMNTRISVSKVYDRLKYFYFKAFNGDSTSLTFEEFTSIMYNLSKIQIICFADNSNNFINNLVNIKFYADEFISAVEKEEKFQNIIKELS